MANLSITISNTLSVFGATPPSLWGVMVWGVDNWGYGSSDLLENVDKLVSNTLTLDSAVALQVEWNPVISNTLTLTEDMTSETLADRSGEGAWLYEFPGSVTNAESRVISSFTASSEATASFTVASAPTTTWT